METGDRDGGPARHDADDVVVVADFEAGIGTLTRMGIGDVDVVLVVVEPTPKSMEVGRRAARLAREKRLGRVVVVANRLRDDEDLARVRAEFDGLHVHPVPDDPGIIAADREGVSPLDHDPECPAVQSLRDLAADLRPR